MTPQIQDVEILHSNERPGLPVVYGTSTPPQGLSGMLRRFAFRFSENSYAHWLPLMVADRINVIEGIVDDLRRGYIPNIFAEKGGKADLKYNRTGLAKRIAVTIAVAATVIYLVRRRHGLSRRKGRSR
jgi:hypothetical protein